MEYILYDQKGQYAIITINRERALNALTPRYWTSWTRRWMALT